MQEQSRESYLSQNCNWATSSFKDHEAKLVGPGHWRLANPKKSEFWCDIVVLGGCGISVWGDIDGCFFAYKNDNGNPESLIHWLNNLHADKPTRYELEKASIGMGGIGVYEYCHKVAISDLRELLTDAELDFSEERWQGIKEEYTEVILDTIEDLGGERTVETIQESLYDRLSHLDPDCSEWMGSIGRVPSTRVIQALAAIRKLSSLLGEENG